MQTSPSSKPRYMPVLHFGAENSFAIQRETLNGHTQKEVVFYRLLNVRMRFTDLFKEIDQFIDEAIQEGEVAPEEKEELINKSRIAVARWLNAWR